MALGRGILLCGFFFSRRRRHTIYWRDWSSDVCSSDLRLVSVDDSRVATGRDFDPATGRVTGEVVHLDEAGARGLAARLEGRQVTVSRVDEKPYRRRPYAPFTTSTLQMEAGRKLGWSSAQTMRVAQRLYENGHITYMRTDSTNLSDEAINAARQQARELYGDAYVPAEARRYKSKTKGAQEAHEIGRASCRERV